MSCVGNEFKVKNCPACGAEVFLEETGYRHGDNYWFIHCGSCGFRYLDSQTDPEVVVKEWNEYVDKFGETRL